MKSRGIIWKQIKNEHKKQEDMFATWLVHFMGLAIGICWFFFCIGIYFLYKSILQGSLEKAQQKEISKIC